MFLRRWKAEYTPSNLGVSDHTLQGRFCHSTNWAALAVSDIPGDSELETRAPSPQSGVTWDGFV